MPHDKIKQGKEAERLAQDFLRKKGYRILTQNYRTRLGEIDIIAQEAKTICFVEVKSRAEKRFGLSKEAVDEIKQRKLIRTALAFLKEKNLTAEKVRFDVVAIDLCAGKKKLDLIKNAFDLDDGYFND